MIFNRERQFFLYLQCNQAQIGKNGSRNVAFANSCMTKQTFTQKANDIPTKQTYTQKANDISTKQTYTFTAVRCDCRKQEKPVPEITPGRAALYLERLKTP